MNDEIFIDEQIDRLPAKIDRFVRRFACLSDDFTIQYTTNGFYTQNSETDLSNPINNDVLYSETGKNLEDVVENILLKNEIKQRLKKTNVSSEPFVYIDHEVIDQGITRISLIRPIGTATMMAPCIPLPPSYFHIYFYIQAEEYLLAFGREGNSYFFRRNDVCVYLSIPSPRAINTQTMAVAIVWALDEIGITGYLDLPIKKETDPRQGIRSRDWKSTTPTVPPNSLYIWARKQLLISEKKYTRSGKVFNVVVDALQSLNEEISVTDDLGSFWDEQREGKKIIELIPKREPIITKHIESRMRDITLQKNINISREVELGNSKLDLLFYAPLTDGNTAKVCVEVKKAHARDLVHGLSVQLPEYMRREGTDFGVYCVLYFGKEYSHQVKPFKELIGAPRFASNLDLYQSDLGILLNMALSRLPFRNVVAVIIDVSQKPSASKL